MNGDRIIEGDTWNYTPGVPTKTLLGSDGPYLEEAKAFALTYDQAEEEAANG